MPRPIIYVLLVLGALSLVPMGLVHRARHSRKSKPRIQVVYDMDNQFTAKTQSESAFFADGMAMRHQPEGTVAQGHLEADDAFYRGRAAAGGDFVAEFPLPVNKELVQRGRERFNIYCAPCHGSSGNGNGLVHARAMALAEGTWTPPSDLRAKSVADRPVGHLYNTIKNGIRTMPGYGPQIEPRDRWAIVAYMRALQLSRNATLEDVPAARRAALTK